jgi:hypothetical protein
VFSEPAAGWGSSPPQVTKLTASDGAAGDQLGSSVAVSGGTAVAGAPRATVGSNASQGAAYVFSEPAAGWGSSPPQVTKLTASDGAAFDFLGPSVAVSGGAIVAGAPQVQVSLNSRQGAAYVFQASPPSLAITSPTSGLTTSTAGVSVMGTASDVFGLGSVTVDGQGVAVSASGSWSTQVSLAPGPNTITVLASGADGLTTTQQITVTYSPPPPSTSIALSPATPNGTNGWYVTPVHATVSASDPSFSVTHTNCELDPGAPPASFGAIPAACAYRGSGAGIASDGQHALYAASVNAAASQETPVSVAFKIDQTAPAVTCFSPAPTFGLGQAGAAVHAAVSDATSGPVAATVSRPVSVSSWGHRTVSLVGVDNAGHSATASCPYSVRPRDLNPDPTMSWTFDSHVSFTIVDLLTVSDVPAGAKIKVSCAGHGCPFKQHVASDRVAVRARCKHKPCHHKTSPQHAYADDLTHLFAKRHLAARTKITVKVVQPNTRSKVWLFQIRANKQQPSRRIIHTLPAP